MNTVFQAGPMLRRVTTEVVCLWLATERDVALKCEVWQGETLLGLAEYQTLQAAECQTKLPAVVKCKLGEKLFVYLLQARPITEGQFFPRDTLLHYKLYVDGGFVDLKALNLTYEQQAHPSFFIPTQLKQLLHGSCRKPHGNEQDALSFGDAELARTHADLAQRPAVLLLTGDQIYADDVADSILNMLKVKALEVLGGASYQELLYREKLPVTRFSRFMAAIKNYLGQKTLNPVVEESALINPANPNDLDRRQRFVRKQAGFSSTEAENHLLTFGEYAAMYLYVFGNAQNWQVDSSQETLARRLRLESFHKTLPQVRRLLANMPTYMIFDDHDVTDDWNITGAWYDKVRERALGRRVIANAMTAYWAFQAWGNAPENFEAEFITTISTYLAAAPSPPEKLAEHFELTVWKHRGWGFSVPLNPPIIAIDSRTQRQPDGNYYPPQLLDRYALDWLRVEWAKLMAQVGEDVPNKLADQMPAWPILMTTTPVMGFAPIEFLQRMVLWLLGAIEDFVLIKMFTKWAGLQGKLTGIGVTQFDAESWVSNYDGYEKFLNCVLHKMGISQCVFLSGDVHYSFSAKAQFESNGKALRCWQLTSSALCNEPSAKNKFSKINDLVNKNAGRFSHQTKSFSLMHRWQVHGEYIVWTDGQGQRISPQCNIGLVSFQQGKPMTHSLLNGKEAMVFSLAELS